MLCSSPCSRPFPKRQSLASSKLKGFADDNFKFDKNGRKFSKTVGNTGKMRNCSLQAISPFPKVFKRLQTHKNQGLFWKGSTHMLVNYVVFWQESVWICTGSLFRNILKSFCCLFLQSNVSSDWINCMV